MPFSKPVSAEARGRWPEAVVAKSFCRRLMGMAHPGRRRGRPLLLPGCRTVHTLFPLRPLLLTFIDQRGAPLAVHRTRWGRFYHHPDAAHAVESDLDEGGSRSAGRPLGVGLTEALVAIPIVLFIGLATAELFLMAQSKLLLSKAAEAAARYSAVREGTPTSVDEGLARGLLPALLTHRIENREASGAAQALLLGSLAYAEARLNRRVHWQRVSPTEESFLDWADPETGRIMPVRSAAGGVPKSPNGAVSGAVGACPVAALSGQTEVDAGMIKLWVGLAVPLRMPLAGPLMAYAIGLSRGCPLDPSFNLEVGPVRLRSDPVLNLATGEAWGPGVFHLEGCALLMGVHPLHLGKHLYVLQAQGIAQTHTPLSRH